MNPYFDPLFPALLAGIALLAWRKTGESRRTRWVLLSLIATAWTYSSPWLSLTAARYLQQAYAADDTALSSDGVAAIVVLAGDGITPNRYQERTLLGEHTLVRLEKAYDLAVKRPELGVIVSGGILFGAKPSITLAGMMRDWLIERAIPARRIVADESSANTYESARRVAQLACPQGEAIFLVTEAVHMPRSVAVFSAQGCRPIPVPCSLLRAEESNIYHFFPAGAGLARTQAIVHELGGLGWYWVSGKLSRNRQAP